MLDELAANLTSEFEPASFLNTAREDVASNVFEPASE